jgi:hypothetical protein
VSSSVSAGRVPAPAVRPIPGADEAGHLADGWEPHREVADGLVRRFVFAYASSMAGPVAALGGTVVRRDGFVLHDLGHPAGYYNGVTLLRPLPYAGWQDVVAELDATIDRDAGGELLLWSAWPTPDLSSLGWDRVGHPPLLLLPPRLEPVPPPPSWLRVEPVEDARRLADWERVAVEGYPFTSSQPVRPGVLVDDRLLRDPGFHAWVGYDGGTPVTIGTSYIAHGCHVFALGVTLPTHRGRGAWQAMAHRRLAAFPQLPALSLFSDMSRPPAERIGFLALSRWTVWSLPRGA